MLIKANGQHDMTIPVLAFLNKLPTLTPAPRYTHLALW